MRFPALEAIYVCLLRLLIVRCVFCVSCDWQQYLLFSTLIIYVPYLLE